MFSVHLFIILSGLILVRSTLDQFKNNPCAKGCPPQCPPGWRVWRDSCYRFTSRMPWGAANTSCKAMGGEMAAPRSLEENGFFVSFGNEENTEEIPKDSWIACNDESVEGEWICNNINHTPTFMSWDAGQPGTKDDQDCAVISKVTGFWKEHDCSHDDHSAVCRLAASEPPRMYCFTANEEGRLDKSCFND